MFHIEPGSYVVHAKLPELGTGEVIASEKGCVRIRFASGERNFNIEFVVPHLSVTAEAPAKPAPVIAGRSLRSLPCRRPFSAGGTTDAAVRAPESAPRARGAYARAAR